ncbi:hypothetical protein [Planobispora rosea]|uniref:hypothetical protein n=1 Tax=Planobispora rosea TaxID=35762 RepID=UPI00159F346A|nr:hypothetical protein [Planobispora rosea]
MSTNKMISSGDGAGLKRYSPSAADVGRVLPGVSMIQAHSRIAACAAELALAGDRIPFA